MNRLFKNVRLGTLEQRNLKKYALYSLGEITLVVIGILIAIQVDNWNESRREEIQFRADVEQIYNTLDRDIDVLNYGIHGFNKQVAIIDSILLSGEKFDHRLLPFLLAYVDVTPDQFHSEITYQLDHLTYDREDPAQRALTKSLSEYSNTLDQNKIFSFQHVTPIFKEQHLSIPTLIFGVSDLHDFSAVDRNLFSENEIIKIRALLKTEQLRNALKSLKSLKQFNTLNLYQIMLSAKAKQNAIIKYFPDVKLLYSKIGLVGDGTANKSWDNDVELIPTDSSKSKWEGDLRLVAGEIKFRNERNWIINWGGSGFPKGQLLFNGENIKTLPGDYHVIVDLKEKTYEFVQKLDR